MSKNHTLATRRRRRSNSEGHVAAWLLPILQKDQCLLPVVVFIIAHIMICSASPIAIATSNTCQMEGWTKECSEDSTFRTKSGVGCEAHEHIHCDMLVVFGISFEEKEQIIGACPCSCGIECKAPLSLPPTTTEIASAKPTPSPTPKIWQDMQTNNSIGTMNEDTTQMPTNSTGTGTKNEETMRSPETQSIPEISPRRKQHPHDVAANADSDLDGDVDYSQYVRIVGFAGVGVGIVLLLGSIIFLMRMRNRSGEVGNDLDAVNEDLEYGKRSNRQDTESLSQQSDHTELNSIQYSDANGRDSSTAIVGNRASCLNMFRGILDCAADGLESTNRNEAKRKAYRTQGLKKSKRKENSKTISHKNASKVVLDGMSQLDRCKDCTRGRICRQHKDGSKATTFVPAF